MMARHIRNGRLLDYAVAANRETDRLLRAKLICASCGLRFVANHPKRTPDAVKTDVCRECAKAID